MRSHVPRTIQVLTRQDVTSLGWNLDGYGEFGRRNVGGSRLETRWRPKRQSLGQLSNGGPPWHTNIRGFLIITAVGRHNDALIDHLLCII